MDDPRIKQYKIPRAVIKARAEELKNYNAFSDSKARGLAIQWLCHAVEDLSRYGATVTWK